MDKLCYWDLLGDLKWLKYDVEMLKLSFLDGERNCRNNSNDDSTVALVDKLRAHHTVDIYAESFNIKRDKNLPSIFMPTVEARAEPAEDGVELNANKEDEGNDSGSGSESDDDEEERLANEQLECNNSNVDEEREKDRENVITISG